jgi:hypothetical protein
MMIITMLLEEDEIRSEAANLHRSKKINEGTDLSRIMRKQGKRTVFPGGLS